MGGWPSNVGSLFLLRGLWFFSLGSPQMALTCNKYIFILSNRMCDFSQTRASSPPGNGHITSGYFTYRVRSSRQRPSCLHTFSASKVADHKYSGNCPYNDRAASINPSSVYGIVYSFIDLPLAPSSVVAIHLPFSHLIGGWPISSSFRSRQLLVMSRLSRRRMLTLLSLEDRRRGGGADGVTSSYSSKTAAIALIGQMPKSLFRH